MVRGLREFIVAGVFAAFASGCILPEGARPSVSAGVEGATQYNHRGMVQVDRPVIQGDTDVRVDTKLGGELNLNSWANMNTTSSVGHAWFPDGEGGKFSEVDLRAAYAQRLEPVDVRFGVLSYIIPNGSDFPNGVRGSTTEFFASVGGEFIGESKIYSMFTIHQDWDEVDGHYLNLEVKRPFPLDALLERLSLEVSSSLGSSDENHSEWTYGLPESALLADLQGHLNFVYQADDRSAYLLGLSGSTIIDNDLRDWFKLIDIDPDNIWLRIGVRWSF